jgi:pimeloyl-ACP methyl ester carboxylesterase
VGAVGRWWRKQVVRPRYGAGAVHLDLPSGDGTRLHAVRLAGPADAIASVVVVHGLTNSTRSPSVHAFAHAVRRWAHVVAVDLRGHGTSDGVCTLGELEPLDVLAAVGAARAAAPALPVVVVGSSMGALASLLAAARPGSGIDGVVSLSAPSRQSLDGPGARRMHSLCTTRRGRAAMRLVFRTRVRSGWWDVDDITTELPGATAGFTVVVHDPHETFFGPAHAELLHELVPEPKELRWVPRGGHGGDLLTPELAASLESDVGPWLARAR